MDLLTYYRDRDLTRKDELYNDILKQLKQRGLDFPRQMAKTEGSYMLQVCHPGLVKSFIIVFILPCYIEDLT